MIVASCLPACCKLIQKKQSPLSVFSVPCDTHGPAQSQRVLVVASPLPQAGLLSYASELSPLKFWLEATTEQLQLELFVIQTRIIKDYFSRFFCCCYTNSPLSVSPEPRVEIVGRAYFLTPVPSAVIRESV